MEFVYHCVECGRRYAPEGDLFYVCPVCAMSQQPGAPIRGALKVILPYSDFAATLDRYYFHVDDWLPIDQEFIPDYPVGNTPLHPPARLREYTQFPNLYLKDESGNPTGSLKDRASLLVAAMAKKLGQERVIVASTGNAASSMAGVAAACGLECIVLVPSTIPKAKLVQAISYGATVIPIEGDYDQAYDLSIALTQHHGWINRNTAYNPFTTEGKKSVAIELYLQLEDRAPDIIFIPTGDGSILSGVYKGFYDLFQLDMIETMPRLVAVQPENSNAIVRALKTNELLPLEIANTIADSLSVKAPRNGIMAIKDIHKSCGFGVTVSDKQILDAQQLLAHQAGVFAEPAAACAFAGFEAVRAELEPETSVVVLLTGSGLKDPDAPADHIKLPEAVPAHIDKILSKIQE